MLATVCTHLHTKYQKIDLGKVHLKSQVIHAITCDEDGAPLMMIVALEFWSVDFKSLWATLLIKIFFYIRVDMHT